jgi:hypothetical protein
MPSAFCRGGRTLRRVGAQDPTQFCAALYINVRCQPQAPGRPSAGAPTPFCESPAKRTKPNRRNIKSVRVLQYTARNARRNWLLLAASTPARSGKAIKPRSQPSATACFNDCVSAAAHSPAARSPAAGSRSATAGLPRSAPQVSSSNLCSSPILFVSSSLTPKFP